MVIWELSSSFNWNQLQVTVRLRRVAASILNWEFLPRDGACCAGSKTDTRLCWFLPSARRFQEGRGADKLEAGRGQLAILSGERVIEGEVLRNRSTPANDSLEQILRRRNFTGEANLPDATTTSQATQHAINAYLENAATSGSGSGAQSHTIDYYV